MPMIHVGTSYENGKLASKVMRLLGDAGFALTRDWTLFDSKSLDARRARMESFQQADGLVLLLPAGRSSHVELGMAIERGIPSVIYAPTVEHLANTKDGRICSYYDHIGVKITHKLEEIITLVEWRIRESKV